ncbi:MAG: hypothetical protein EOO88_20695 [Pedobacter sp.]|nr:MAG: hypothetical protein EOO88_20695 [Pedobacter sp.]
MKKVSVAICLVLFISCSSRDGMRPEEFNNVPGFLYFEKPEAGSVVNVYFYPYFGNTANVNCTILDSLHLRKGIKMNIANSLIKDQLYTFKSEKIVFKGSTDRSVYLVCNAKLYFHNEESAKHGADVIDEEIHADTLIKKNTVMVLYHRQAYLVLDSIKTR